MDNIENKDELNVAEETNEAVVSEEASAEEAVSAPVEEKSKVKMNWYVVHTLSGHEKKVKRNLDALLETSDVKDLVGRIVIPSETVSEVRGGKKSIRERQIFPGYVLAEMNMTNEVWHFFKEVDGVIGFLGASNEPQPLLPHEVEEILMQLDEKKDKVTPKVRFEKGELIKITDGPFVNFTGAIDEVQPDKGKLKVMVSIFGRATPVELEYWQVEKV